MLEAVLEPHSIILQVINDAAKIQAYKVMQNIIHLNLLINANSKNYHRYACMIKCTKCYHEVYPNL